ncbi:response regulator transcription factor [Pseudooceanicola aestuarii]|uniref:response regulator transcription factor n=1 Tax=Pseudooceanicola aestuarii TaxID=2697319 RepID=UPI0013D32093|nr:response regulator transcription factor [Pseudooceanicola aestuarii]
MTNAAPSLNSLRVLVADDHEMLLEMIDMHLSGQPDMEVTTAKTLGEALDEVALAGGFDLVLLDLNMPGMNGMTGLPKMMAANKGKPVAIFTGNPPLRIVEEIVEAGASGIVLKTTPLRTLANAIRFMAAGDQYIPRELTFRRADEKPQNDTTLSVKEMEVLGYLAEGHSNRDIASALSLAEPTIKMHVRAICTKLGVKNRTQAVVTAKDLGIA